MFFAGLLVCVLLILGAAPSLDAGVCERALQKCAIDAAIAGITGGAFAGLSWASLCLAGYDWCIRYYVN